MDNKKTPADKEKLRRRLQYRRRLERPEEAPLTPHGATSIQDIFHTSTSTISTVTGNRKGSAIESKHTNSINDLLRKTRPPASSPPTPPPIDWPEESQ
ncbi:MAG TPA: hypothetical protein VJA27_03195 [Patescibacteria group bacterium]|nr:hypothetical protein [Patescibacteria group bacterium]